MNAMCKFFKKQGQYESTATVVDGNLILTLPDAINPVIWRMELGNVKSSALEIRANDNHFLLALKTPKGDVHDIAPFESRERALHALMQVSSALGKAEGKMVPPSAANTIQSAQPVYAAPAAHKSSGAGYKWLAALAAVIVMIFLFSFVSGLSPDPEIMGTVTDSGASLNSGESGVPLSADDVLRGLN